MSRETVERPSKELIEKFKELSTSTVWSMIGRVLHDRRLNDMYYMENMKPLSQDLKLVGPALTIKFFPIEYQDVILDKLDMGYRDMTQRIWEAIQPGDVLVAAALGHKMGPKNVGIWGDVVNTSYAARGAAGLICDGCVRDTPGVRKIFPVLLTGVGTVRPHRGVTPISVKTVVDCDGVRVRQGDIIVGDELGVVVVPIEIAEQVAEMGLKIEESEQLSMKNFREGKSIKEVAAMGLTL